MELNGPTPGRLREKRTNTFAGTITAPAIIDRFVEDYSFEHYDQLAKLAKSFIDDALDQLKDSNGQKVQARVTCRAKDPKSLWQKLMTRNAKKRYQTTEEIRVEMHDLAGVRITLYTPTAEQYDGVKEMIEKIWGTDVLLKQHGASNLSTNADTSSRVVGDQLLDTDEECIHEKKKYIPKHFGYQARHYHAPMNPKLEVKNSTYKFQTHDVVEIQVMSALNSAWADAGHDILYKQYEYGSPSEQEERVMDCLSGLVSSGDVLLEQLYELVNQRTFRKIQHRDEFGTFLRNLDILNVPQKPRGSVRYLEDFNKSEGIDVLFQFLVKRNENYPVAVRDALKVLGYPADPTSRFGELLKSFDPCINPPTGLIAPLCLICRMLGEGQRQSQSLKKHAPAEQCCILINALILLQTFSGGPTAANEFLSFQFEMSNTERDGLNWVLFNSRRSDCLAGRDMREKDSDALQSAWDWFRKQSAERRSVCGMLFYLAEMGLVRGDGMDALIERLSIGTLSKLNASAAKNGAK